MLALVNLTAPMFNLTGQDMGDTVVNIKGVLNVEGDVNVTKNVQAGGTVIDAKGNTNNHVH